MLLLMCAVGIAAARGRECQMKKKGITSSRVPNLKVPPAMRVDPRGKKLVPAKPRRVSKLGNPSRASAGQQIFKK
jgi:hypothetical protein